MGLSKQEIDLAVLKSVDSLDDVTGTVVGPAPLKNYYDTIGVQNIKAGGIKGRVVRKFLLPFIVVVKKLFQEYFQQQTIVDTYTRDMLFQQQQTLLSFRADLEQRIDQKIYETHKLVDGFKSEVLAEINDTRSRTKEKEQAKTEIINKRRAETLKKINIGSGRDVREDYVNVDHRALAGVDVVADVLDLPFKSGSLDEVLASHVAEHFTQRNFSKILAYWYSLLKKGGSVRLIVPNIDAMARGYARGEVTWDQLRSVALGGQDYASDFHFNHFSIDSMRALVNSVVPEAKFTVVEPARRNGESLEMEVLITK